MNFSFNRCVRYNDITSPNGTANFEHLMINDIEKLKL